MRRLWSHIVLAATSLMMVGATFATVVTNIDSNIEYSSGREFVFRVSVKGEDGNPDNSISLDENDKPAVQDIANIMEERLQTSEVSRYRIDIQGYDTIKVTFEQDEAAQYNIIQNYLSFNATLAISNSKGTYATSNEFLTDKEAYLEYTDGYPAVVIPINKDNEQWKAVYSQAKEMSDNNEGEYIQQHEHEEGEEETEEQHIAYLYLWYNFQEDYYSYDKIDTSSPDTYNPTIADKILMKFDAANPFYDEEEDALRAYVSPEATGSEVTPEALKSAYENARYYVNLLNAKPFADGVVEGKSYTVSFLFYENAKLWAEQTDEGLIALGSHMSVAWSRTFIATLCAVVVISLLLVYFYRLGALSIGTVSIVSTFAGLIFIVLFSAEFSVAGVIGLISLALTSIISGVIYLNKMKEECYRGRSLKKANAEAAKKALLPTIDVHFVLVAVGVACYLLGGPLMKGFALCTILGGIVSLLLSIFGLRGLMWLVTNEQGIANRYDLFDVSNDQVPNALEEEKQKYYGANADRDFTKAKKPVGIAAAALLLASVVGLIVFGAVNKGAVYAPLSDQANSQVYVEYTSYSADNTYLSRVTKEQINTMLDNATIDGAKLSSMSTIDTYTYTSEYRSTKSGIENVYFACYRVSFDKVLGEDTVVTYTKGDGTTLNMPVKELFTTEGVQDADLEFDYSVTLSFKNSVRNNADQPAFSSLILATTVAAGISFLYLLLRYRLSRGIAVLGIVVLSVGISAGLFCLIHIPVSSYISVALPLIAMFTFDIAILFMNKEREMVLEDRSKDNSVEARDALMIKALGISSTPIIISYIIALYLGVNFFGFMLTSVSWVFLLVILGVTIATALVLIFFGPLSQILFKWFSNINIVKPQTNKKRKPRQVRVKKSAEPEEAIFIGIND